MTLIKKVFTLLLPVVIAACNSSRENKETDSAASDQGLPARFEISAIRMQAVPDTTFRVLISHDGHSGEALPVFPRLKGIPDTLKNIRKYHIPIDYVQTVFQAYKSGAISRELMIDRLRRDVKDTINCTADHVKSYISFITGVYQGDKYYIIDTDNNDDLIHENVSRLAFYAASANPGKVLYERLTNGKIVQDSTWLTFHSIKGTEALTFSFCEQTTAAFRFDSIRYIIKARPIRGFSTDYSENISFEISDSLHPLNRLFEDNQYARLGNHVLQSTSSSDGRNFVFTLDTNALKTGSTQKFMPAIPFKAETYTGDSVSFPSDFRGKYVLLDFWSTGCPHCVEDIRNIYLSLYKKYGGKRFEIIGISPDPKNKVERFVRQNGIQWTMISAPDGKIQNFYKVESYPAIYLVDTTGVIIAKSQDIAKDRLNILIYKLMGEK